MSTSTATADTIGTLRASIAGLQTELKYAEQSLKDDQSNNATDGTYEGELFRITISWADRKTTAWKAIAEKLEASKQMIAGNTKSKSIQTLRCTAKLKGAA